MLIGAQSRIQHARTEHSMLGEEYEPKRNTFAGGSRQQLEGEHAAEVRELRHELAGARSQIEQLQEECRRARYVCVRACPGLNSSELLFTVPS
eukprot:1158006-Pelagomonas_calceolata.AAC.24